MVRLTSEIFQLLFGHVLMRSGCRKSGGLFCSDCVRLARLRHFRALGRDQNRPEAPPPPELPPPNPPPPPPPELRDDAVRMICGMTKNSSS